MVGQLSGGCLSWGELFEANCPAGKSPEDNYLWGKFYGGNCVEGFCYRRNCSRAIVWKARVSGVIVLRGVSFGGNALWTRSPGVNFPGGDFMGVIV